jgi:iron complex transport system permease protein
MSNDAKTKEKMRIAVFCGLCILLVAGIFVSIGSGTVSLSVSETWAALLGEADADTDRIVNLIRLPRTIVTVLVGANLALAGCNLQGVLHNPLADPGIIGVSAGAGLFAMVIMLLASVVMVVVLAVMPLDWLMSIAAATVIACIVRKAKRYNATFSNSRFFIF